jgi:hypothetical protein
MARFAGVVVTGGSLALCVAGTGEAATHVKGGDNGTVKIHSSTTPVTDPRNEPHVCVFYLDAFGFDPGQSVSWQIKSWPPTGDRAVVASGMQALDSSGDGHTGDMTLPNGHYKLFWNFTGEHGFAKQKVFWVACAVPTTTPTPTPSTSPTVTPSASPTPSTSPTVTPSASPTPSTSPTVTPSASPSPSPTSPALPAPAPTPVQGTLPVTG